MTDQKRSPIETQGYTRLAGVVGEKGAFFDAVLEKAPVGMKNRALSLSYQFN